MSVYLFKIVSGEEVVASVVDDTNPSYIKIKCARSIVVVPSGPQQYRLDFAPFMRADIDGELRLMKNAIAAETPAHKELETAYLSQTSGIEIASALHPLMG